MKNKVIIIFLVLLIISGIAFFYYKKINTNDKVEIEKTVSQIKGFDYLLYDSDTKAYKDEFNILKKNLTSDEIDYNEYAKSIAKMFLIDLYDLNSKNNMYDVGGTQFIYPDSRENYSLNVTNTLYKYMEDKSTRKNVLPIVDSVDILSIENSSYKIEEDEYESYIIKAKINYEEDLGYDSEVEVILVKKDKYLYVVEKN